MPLDLVGKLHRTVYVTGCPDDAYDDLARLLLQRCGAIEAWDVDAPRMTVVFQSVNSVSNALTFSGMAFMDLTRSLTVWRANERAPAHVAQQLAITSNSNNNSASSSSNNAGDSNAVVETADERAARAAARERRRAAVQALLQEHNDDADAIDWSVPARRDAKMLELCRRQLRALCTLTAEAVRAEQRVLDEKRQQLRVTQTLLATAQAKHSTTTVTPLSSSSNGDAVAVDETTTATTAVADDA